MVLVKKEVFGDVFVRKQAFLSFLDNIKMELKRRQNWHFCKVHDFVQKGEVFICFVFSKNRSRKSVC